MNRKFFDIPSHLRPFLRHPRTQQERKRNSRREERRFVRGRRFPRNLPTAYDDYFIPLWKKNNCWKLMRETQYRPLAG